MDIAQARERLSTAGLFLVPPRADYILGFLPAQHDDNQQFVALGRDFCIASLGRQWQVCVTYGQAGVYIKSSDDLAQAVTAVVDYFELVRQLNLPHTVVRKLLRLYAYHGLFVDINSPTEIMLTLRGNSVEKKPSTSFPGSAPKADITDQWNLVMNADETWSAQHPGNAYERRFQCFIEAADHILKAYGISRLRQFAFSPDQRRIALAWGHEQHYIEVFERQDEGICTEIYQDEAHFAAFYWSPDSRHLAVLRHRAGEGNAELWLLKTYRVEYEQEFKRPTRRGQGYHHGNYHSYMFGRSDSSLIEVIHREPATTANTAQLPVLVKWHPESELVAAAFPHRLTIFDPFQDVEVVSYETQDIQHLEWTPDGQEIITQSDQHGTQRWLGPAG